MPDSMTDSLVSLSIWLDREIAEVEAKLAANPPLCTLDRHGSAPIGLKELEGRYAMLRRGRRLLHAGRDLADLDHEVHKAEQIAHASRDASPQWIGYARGVAGARDDIRRQRELPAGERSASGAN